MASSDLHGSQPLPLSLSTLVLLLITFLRCVSATNPPSFIYASCRSDSNYTLTGPFQANLRRLLASLPTMTAASDGFYNYTVGQAADKVYGLALCRGDISGEPCRECLSSAASRVAEVCPNRKAATMYYVTCLLRYSNNDFFGTDPGGEYTEVNSNAVTNAPNYSETLGNLLKWLITRAVASPRLFAAGHVAVNGFRNVYGVVQCTRDISPDLCEQCLTFMILYTQTCCATLPGAKQMGPSCFLRFEPARFYDISHDSILQLPATCKKA